MSTDISRDTLQGFHYFLHRLMTICKHSHARCRVLHREGGRTYEPYMIEEWNIQNLQETTHKAVYLELHGVGGSYWSDLERRVRFAFLQELLLSHGYCHSDAGSIWQGQVLHALSNSIGQPAPFSIVIWYAHTRIYEWRHLPFRFMAIESDWSGNVCRYYTFAATLHINLGSDCNNLSLWS